MSDSIVRTPWKDYMGEVPMHLEYFDGSMFEAVENVAKKYPNSIAFTFMGKSTTYRQMIREIEQCAKALKTIGVREGDKVTIAMPNCPQAIYMFYAVNLVGGIANMIHPLSAEKEIEFYLNASESVAAVTLDQFYNKFEKVRERTKVVNMIIASVRDALSPTIKAGYMLTEGRKIEKIPEDAPVIMWKDFMKLSRSCYYKTYKVKREGADPAVILYSGGTTGEPNVPSRRPHAGGDAAVSRLRPRRVRAHDALAGRPLHPDPALYGQELRQADREVQVQLHCRRPHAV